MKSLIFNRRILLPFYALFVFSMNASAQTLDMGDIIYSRLPVAPSPSGTIWAVRQDGANNRQIAVGSQPRLSPDGHYLLFRRNQFPSEPYRFGQLFVRDLTNGTETLVLSYNEYLVGYYFTPDSAQIVFDDGRFSGIFKIDRDGTNQIAVGGVSTFDDFPVVRTSDGLIAHQRYDGSPSAGIYTMAFNGANQQFVPNTLNGAYPAWSTDGQFIAFGSVSPSGTYPFYSSNLFKIKPDGSGKVQLTNLAAGNNFATGFAWTSNGLKIIVAANLNSNAGLYSINADGSGNPVLIPTSNGAAPDFVGGIVTVQSGSSGNYSLLQSVIAGGGERSVNGNYSMTSTIGEAIAGQTLLSGSYKMQTGFWANLSSIRTPFDFDGDGKTDIGIFRPGPGEWWYLKSSDGTNRAFQFGQGSDKIVAADYTGDGKTDVAFWRPASGEWFILRSEDSSFYSFPFGLSNDIPAPADYDGDGKADPAVFRQSTATWYINQSSGGFRIVPFGADGDVPAVADYDGDGKADITIFRPSNGSWWSYRSQNLNMIVYTFGTGTDKTVQGDYTGDGKADIAFWRPSTGFWYILRSEDNSFYSFPFGAGGDLPVPGDYDGDGKTDPAVFRPSNSVWYLQQSTSGSAAFAFGVTGDIPVPNAFIR